MRITSYIAKNVYVFPHRSKIHLLCVLFFGKKSLRRFLTHESDGEKCYNNKALKRTFSWSKISLADFLKMRDIFSLSVCTFNRSSSSSDFEMDVNCINNDVLFQDLSVFAAT